MEVVLHLAGYCIETAAKKRYEMLVQKLLNEDIEDENKERELEFLLEFLKNANFSELRRQGFDGSREMRVKVKREGKDFIIEEI
ncbi:MULTISPECIES: hypothetical protein [unclassified Archaeoglobus]|mgnify:CR=1 FL=1|jgi:hypothetical protein|uniref:hypothetical protein n=1 Tax=unclassified Archaeoglobus TaxID=2643606 RepID=UPI0025BDE6C3|nr:MULTISPECIES: hypothetical protein [unclassified Archaeoglobus]